MFNINLNFWLQHAKENCACMLKKVCGCDIFDHMRNSSATDVNNGAEKYYIYNLSEYLQT